MNGKEVTGTEDAAMGRRGDAGTTQLETANIQRSTSNIEGVAEQSRTRTKGIKTEGGSTELHGRERAQEELTADERRSTQIKINAAAWAGGAGGDSKSERVGGAKSGRRGGPDAGPEAGAPDESRTTTREPETANSEWTLGVKPQINADERRSEGRRRVEQGETEFMDALLRFTRSAKRSKVPEVAVAARRWEGKIHFHIRVALKKRGKI